MPKVSGPLGISVPARGYNEQVFVQGHWSVFWFLEFMFLLLLSGDFNEHSHLEAMHDQIPGRYAQNSWSRHWAAEAYKHLIGETTGLTHLSICLKP